MSTWSLVLVLSLLACTSCVSSAQRAVQQQQDCRSYEYQENTPEWSQCLMLQDLAYKQNKAAKDAALLQLLFMRR